MDHVFNLRMLQFFFPVNRDPDCPFSKWFDCAYLSLAMPDYANLFHRLFESQPALAIAHRCDSPIGVIELGHVGLRQHLREKKIAHRAPRIDKVLTWAAQTIDNTVQDGPLHHAIWSDLHELYQCFHRKITFWSNSASDLVQTPYVRLLAIPVINVVSAAELAGEMGPSKRFANDVRTESIMCCTCRHRPRPPCAPRRVETPRANRHRV